MAYLNGSHPGLAYGDGTMQGAGAMGQFVKAVGNDIFAVNTSSTVKSFGILRKDYADGEMPGVWCCGGVFETDQFGGEIAVNGLLMVGDAGKLVALTGEGAIPVAQAISVSGGILKFKLLI